MIPQSSSPQKGGFRTMPFIIGKHISLSPVYKRVIYQTLTLVSFVFCSTVNESFEKVVGYGLMPNMIFYLMSGYHIATANGATILALWSATSNAMAIVGAFLSDSYIGRFWAILLGSFSSLLVSLSLTSFPFIKVLAIQSRIYLHHKVLLKLINMNLLIDCRRIQTVFISLVIFFSVSVILFCIL